MPLPVSFHPVIRGWFSQTYGEPTAVQAQAWPLIEQGKHVLAIAPTGSGKTLTAFLSAISRFCPPTDGGTPPYKPEELSVLYVSPLKALNEDIKRNLLEPINALQSRFTEAGLPFPELRVETRSGDTPQSARRRLLVKPPAVLALTPESLAILLLNPRGRQVLSHVKYLIIDEIHAVLGNKRGAFLSCQIDRLAAIAGEFQRISLSATIRNPDAAAEFIGGYDRDVAVVAPQTEKQIELTIHYPPAPLDFRTAALAETSLQPSAEISAAPPNTEQRQIADYGNRYTVIINYILGRIKEHSTILVFTDSRRRSERLCYYINREHGVLNPHNAGPVAFTHHGSLSTELRRTVEKRLAEGRLPCVVATASLELGIDIGSIDEVILAGSPASVSQAMQRIGRAGHRVGSISHASLFPFHGLDMLSAVALETAVAEKDIEEIRPIKNPLDILAQIILSLVAEQNRNIEELYTTIRGFYLFRSLTKASYVRTVRMLAGLGEKARMRALKPRVWLDSETGEIGGLAGTLPLLYTSGGVIASRGLYSLRLQDGTKIGEVDEEFVWERRLGDCFDFGGRPWRIISIGPEAVEVIPLNTLADFIPFWHAEMMFRSSNLSQRILSILDNADNGNIPYELRLFLDSQRAAQGGSALPGSGTVTVEIIEDSENAKDYINMVIHTFRGGAINYPLSLSLSQDMEERLELRVESFANDDSVLFFIPRMAVQANSRENTGTAAEKLLLKCLVTINEPADGGITRGERLFRKRLETTGIFGAEFREAAERSMALPRAAYGKRVPLWITRQRSKRLFDAAAGEEGFPVTAEAWRSCLNDIFDIQGFTDLADDIHDGTVSLSVFHTPRPTPFSANLVRQETNTLIYEYDERKDLRFAGGGKTPLSDRVIEEALSNASLRPALKPALIADFTSRLHREIPGWTPDDELSLSEWIKERIAIPLDEWEILHAALPDTLREAVAYRSGGELPYLAAHTCLNKIQIIKLNGADVASLVHREWEKTWNTEAVSLLGPWLRYQGPVSVARIAGVFGVSRAEAEDAATALTEVEEIVTDVKIDDAPVEHADSLNPRLLASDSQSPFICDRENMEMLLRLARRKARPLVKEQPAALLTPFLALRQGIIPAMGGTRNDAVPRQISCYPAQAKLWETEIFTARMSAYNRQTLDRCLGEGTAIWYGDSKKRIGFCAPEDWELVSHDRASFVNQNKQLDQPNSDAAVQLIKQGFFHTSRDFWEIKEQLEKLHPGIRSADCIRAVWQLVWSGWLSCETFDPVRAGIDFGFEPDEKIEKETEHFAETAQAAPFTPGRMPRVPRALRDRWKKGAPLAGSWFSLDLEESGDLLDEDALNRERIRLLAGRYGVLCRPLLENESPGLSWSALLPCIRRMELAGELVCGRFFDGVNSLQFAPPAVIREIEHAGETTELYWMNAADPASPAGLEIDGLPSQLPSRSSANRLYFRGPQLIAVSNRNGKELHIFVAHDDKDIGALVSLFKIPRTRGVLPEKKLVIEKINGQSALASPYAALFIEAGYVADRGNLYLW